MKMAKADEKDMEAALELGAILNTVDSGWYPCCDDADDDTPNFFDEDDPEHLRFFYDRIMKLMNNAPGFVGRVVGGFHTLMHNDLVDPDKSYLDYHPRIVQALQLLDSAPSCEGEEEVLP